MKINIQQKFKIIIRRKNNYTFYLLKLKLAIGKIVFNNDLLFVKN